jgi:hypothetical protein
MWYVITETIVHPCGGTIVEKGQCLYIEQVHALARETGIDSLPCVVCLTPAVAGSVMQALRT